MQHARLTAWTAAALLAGGTAEAQTTFSIDYKGPTIGVAPGLTEGDILGPAGGSAALGPLAPPVIVHSAGVGGLGLGKHAMCTTPTPGVQCRIEVDALSYGLDAPMHATNPPAKWWFSVESISVGVTGSMSPPAVWTEGAVFESGADVFVDLGLPMLPAGPLTATPANTAAIDGNGTAGPSFFAYPGLGLVEPTSGGCGLPDSGDNLDALEVDGPSTFPIYFSLDAAFADLCGLALAGSASVHGFAPGDVIVNTGAGPVLYAPAAMLGLDMLGAHSDDLDALILFENGIPGYQPSTTPFDWLSGTTDMLIFSVRRGSAVIGTADSIFAVPIEAGDLLVPPIALGLSTGPGILVAAEHLGLSTARAGGFMDDLDAADALAVAQFDCNGNGDEDSYEIALGLEMDCNLNGIPDSCEPDCNSNGVPDECDIALGTSPDCNLNGIPDECDPFPDSYCTAGSSASGCTATIAAVGMPSASAASGFFLTAFGVEGGKDGLFFFGANGRQAATWGNGTSFQCVVPPVKRAGLLSGSGTTGLCDGLFAKDLNARWCPVCPKPLQNPGAGTVVQAQLWYRDPMNTSNQTTSLSDAVEFAVCP